MGTTASTYLTGFGRYLPGDPVDNEGIVGRLGGDDPVTSRIRGMILDQNGIRQRHYALDEHGDHLAVARFDQDFEVFARADRLHGNHGPSVGPDGHERYAAFLGHEEQVQTGRAPDFEILSRRDRSEGSAEEHLKDRDSNPLRGVHGGLHIRQRATQLRVTFGSRWPAFAVGFGEAGLRTSNC